MNASLSETLRENALSFLSRCRKEPCAYALTPLAETTGYARCFAVFNQTLLKALPEEQSARQEMARALENEIRAKRKTATEADLSGKPYRQLLTFTLSALAAMGELRKEILADLVEEQISEDIARDLEELGCLKGRAGSGNQAMFLAVFLIHARDFLGKDTQARIDDWVALHLRRMNRFGFWGPDRGMTHLQFQNGYHQYEILDYLGIKNPKEEEAIIAVRSLADSLGHFAPSPGGGGCHDYDAVFILTPEGRKLDPATRLLLEKTAATIAGEQRPDGGFAESLYVRPRSLGNLGRFAKTVCAAAAQGNVPLFLERLRYALTLQRPVHDRVSTHWSLYARRWDEADLWDTWFRMMALARIQIALDPACAKDWGFIDYSGIGYHSCLKNGVA